MLVLRPPGLDYFPALFTSFSAVSSSRGINSQLKWSNTIKDDHQKVAVAKQKTQETWMYEDFYYRIEYNLCSMSKMLW